MRACGSEAILLLVQLCEASNGQSLPEWAREPALRIVKRYRQATATLSREFGKVKRDYR